MCKPCSECDYFVNNTAALRYHKTNKHQNIVYNCDQCNFTAKVSATLRYHNNPNHNNITHVMNVVFWQKLPCITTRNGSTKAAHISVTNVITQQNSPRHCVTTKHESTTIFINRVINVIIWQKLLLPFVATRNPSMKTYIIVTNVITK